MSDNTLNETEVVSSKPPGLFRNYISFIGGAITVASLVSLVLLFLVEITSKQENPYLGLLTYILIPSVLIFGVLVIIVGMILERRRRRKGKSSQIPTYPTFDLNDPRARHEVSRIDNTVRALLGRARARLVSVRLTSLTETVAHAVSLAKSQIMTAVTNGQQVAIEYDHPDDPITIQIDPGQIEDAVLNLVLNAIEAVDGKGNIRVRVFRANSDSIEEEQAIVEVSDDGHGIREEDLARLFSAFFTTKREGTGLGLPAVKRIARLHGGRVEVRSSVGQGSVFTIHLPVPRIP